MLSETYDRREWLRLAGAGAVVGVLAGCGSSSGEGPQTAALVKAPSSADDLCFTSARELAALIQSARGLGARGHGRASRPDRRASTRASTPSSRSSTTSSASRSPTRPTAVCRDGEPLGPLHGLPIAFKDLQPAVGFPFTRGSPIYKDDMPTEDSVLVERLRRAGAIPIGKTNVPEFGMGSHTYNKVYGTTLNPYDLTKSAGGSSGGAGAALAAGMLPIADGSDLGGSLRNPANFNNIVGFRPTVGLVPTAPNPLPLPRLRRSTDRWRGRWPTSRSC